MPSLLEAIERKYFASCEFEIDNGSNTDEFRIASTVQADKLLFSIFVPRLSPLMLVPELLVLNDCDIDSAGDFETIKEKCQRVRELDLAQNKLRDWQEVFQILQHMPRIEFLNLSKNQLGSISRYEPVQLTNLKGIVLNGTNLDWHCVDVLLENLPALEELHLSLNNYKEVLIDINPSAVAVAVDVEESKTNTDVVTTATTNCHNINESNCQTQQYNSISTTTTTTTTTTQTNPPDDNETAVNETDDKRTADDSENNSECECSSTSKCKHIRAHQALRTLHFTGNPIEHWHDICRLGRVFPSLQNLVLAECPIKSLTVKQSIELQQAEAEHQAPAASENKNAATATAKDEATYKHFLNLLFLNLSSAHINTWEDIDQLSAFPKLKSLRVKHWPLWDSVECTEHERRQLLIARLPNITCLNGGVISADEREDAERAFIRYYMEKPECERPQRYAELSAKHGRLDPLVNINLKPDKRIQVLLNYNNTTEERLVDVYCTVADFKVRLEKVVHMPASKMRLYYLDQDYKEFGPEEMRYPNKQLYSYNIHSGDEIIVDEKK